MNLIERIMKNNPCYTAGRTITVAGLMLHSVACSQPDANVFINSWNKSTFKAACVHAFIDGNDGIIYQTLPWSHRGWHCGSGSNGSGNNTHIGVEMCEPSCITYVTPSTFKVNNLAEAQACVKRTYESAVELFAYLCKEYNLDPLADGVIISHKEGHSRGIATDHGDPEHLWKGVGLSYTMDGFRADVKAKMGGGDILPTTTSTWYRVRKTWADSATQKGAFHDLTKAKACADKNAGYSVFDDSGNAIYPVTASTTPTYTVGKQYTLQAEIKVRKGAGTNYAAKTHAELTTDGQKHDADKDGCLDKGTVVTCQEVKTVGSDIWIRCPSGWIAAYYGGKVYLK